MERCYVEPFLCRSPWACCFPPGLLLILGILLLLGMLHGVLLHNGGFCKTCTMKRCLQRKVDFRTNALNNAHVSLLLHDKAGLLQNDGISAYFKIKTNSLQVDTSHRTQLVLSTFDCLNQIQNQQKF
jgi:hypothetical protein